MKHTEHYQLNQWEANDKVQRTDFNADNAKIDAALNRMPKITVGTYVGDGAASRFIALGFTPKAVYVCMASGATYGYWSSDHQFFGGLALPDHPAGTPSGGAVHAVAIAEGGFQVAFNTTLYSQQNVLSNSNGSTYHYIALS